MSHSPAPRVRRQVSGDLLLWKNCILRRNRNGLVVRPE